jgi:ATP-dependent DNA ligase
LNQCIIQEHNIPIENRINKLEKMFNEVELPNIKPVTRQYIVNREQIDEFYEEVVSAGGEGLIINPSKSIIVALTG